MAIGRTILALLVAFSVATLPVAGGAAVSVNSAEASVSDAMSDDCDHHVMPCQKAKDDCGSMAACALKCFGFSVSSISDFIFPLTLADATSSLASNPFRSHIGSPPFPPPRV